ncbi:hypothetical protein SDC9_129857 [bioreactor metagenome]|uniref:Uncharacterized protein n=1 Tax=bioreactor metagenome TaxID=1076179 RepID=A0A645D100_9ZZZZ
MQSYHDLVGVIEATDAVMVFGGLLPCSDKTYSQNVKKRLHFVKQEGFFCFHQNVEVQF